MIMREQAKIKPADYLAILGFLKKHHPGYRDIVIPSDALCDTPGWQPEQITDETHDGNCDDEGDRDVENTLLGPTYVYSSASEPNQESGAFRNPSEFVCALLDPKRETNPEMMIYGGDKDRDKG
ncbi:hypothetical protein THAOC_06590 [Thalassiosira oceanica]|uniref:Uncharacterized protein n=1 Tax=Thalassiosira oceanica TaxID=159749 RepID=K0TLK2_THAOC|nr:hypothetical protein THAOC_06590 [Thalassiosira oceanica]|eukprot:EJK71927.1 hypothetical protein THAOC_06590 [Thalassiosira oceanica]